MKVFVVGTFIDNCALESIFHVSKTLQLVMLFGMDGLNNNSMENAFGERPSAGKSFEVTLANKAASKLFNLGTELMLNAENLFIKFHTSD